MKIQQLCYVFMATVGFTLAVLTLIFWNRPPVITMAAVCLALGISNVNLFLQKRSGE